MPTIIRAFGCQFKCGQRVVTSKQSMVRHEGQCIRNPETRSCPTCEHNDFEVWDPDVGMIGGHYCTEDHLKEGQRLAIQCEHWKPKQ